MGPGSAGGRSGSQRPGEEEHPPGRSRWLRAAQAAGQGVWTAPGRVITLPPLLWLRANFRPDEHLQVKSDFSAVPAGAARTCARGWSPLGLFGSGAPLFLCKTVKTMRPAA